QYTSPRGNARLEGRVVLVVHSGYYRQGKGESWVQHDVEVFCKVDSRGWKTLARSARPLLERVLEDQVREAGWFVSLMGRLVVLYPNWAIQVTHAQGDLDTEARQRFRERVVQPRRPGAFNGRPTVTAKTDSSMAVRR